MSEPKRTDANSPEPNRIGEDHMASSKKARDMRRQSVEQWNKIYLNLVKWNVAHKRWPREWYRIEVKPEDYFEVG
jgi:hypothetical protein